MEYLAFGLLGLGIIFILTGILSGRQTTARVDNAPKGGTPAKQPGPGLPVYGPNSYPESPPENPVRTVQINQYEKRAMIFSEEAVMYTDKSGKNVYDAQTSGALVLNTRGIHRVGRGILAFDGYTFFFNYKQSAESIKLAEVEKINFYPNCMVLTNKINGDAYLFFIDNTSSIKVLIDQYSLSHAPQ